MVMFNSSTVQVTGGKPPLQKKVGAKTLKSRVFPENGPISRKFIKINFGGLACFMPAKDRFIWRPTRAIYPCLHSWREVERLVWSLNKQYDCG